MSDKVQFRMSIDSDDLPPVAANGYHFIISMGDDVRGAEIAIAPVSNDYNIWSPDFIIFLSNYLPIYLCLLVQKLFD